MTSFSIECATCKAKLRVRDATAVGQIFACPKCGSMVLVQAPTGTVLPPASEQPAPKSLPPKGSSTARRAPHDSKADTASATLDGLNSEKPDVSLSSESSAVRAGAVSAGTGEKFAGRPPDDPSASEPVEFEPQTSIEQPLPDAAFVSPQVMMVRRVMLIGATTLAAVVLSILIVGYLGAKLGSAKHAGDPDSQKSPSELESADAQAAATQSSTTNLDGREQVGEAASASGGAANSGPTPVPPVGIETGKPEQGTEDATTNPANKPAESETPKPKGSDGPGPDAGTLERGPAGDREADRKTSATETKSDEPQHEETQETKPAAAGRSPFGRFSELLSFSSGSSQRDNTAEKETKRKPVPQAEADNDEEIPQLPRPRMRDVDLEARLKDRLGRVKYGGVRLADLLSELAEFSTIPISLNSRVLAIQQVDLQGKIQLEASDLSLVDLLSKVLSPLALGMGADGNVLVVGYPESMLTPNSTSKYPVGDLIGERSEDGELFIERIKAFVSPESWDSSGGEGSLQIDGKNLVMANVSAACVAEVACFCDQLREALGQKTKNYPAEKLSALRSPWIDNDRLLKPVTLNYVRPAKWTQVLHKIGELTETTILVDWRGVAESGWNPDALRTFSVEGKSLAETLTLMLEPMGLVYQLADRDVIEITGANRQLASLRVAVYPVAKLLNADRSMDQLQDMLKMSIDGALLKENGGPGELAADSTGTLLLVSLPYPQQVTVAAALQKLEHPPSEPGANTTP